ncbi:MAG: leucyl/phenylalanyl-tRNA--protein transferase [Candidatus Rifleibacteriota bacterium]
MKFDIGNYRSLIKFPPVDQADEDGLLAWGGNLEPETLVEAYSHGIFPWTVNPITWWSPDPRAIFEIKGFRLSNRMERMYKNSKFKFTINRAFSSVIRNCADPGYKGREQTWISPEFIEAYERLHELGIAHSVEAWHGEELAGGLYGVALGGFFAGESMFYRISNASTLCLRFFMEYLENKGFELFDSQVSTPHTLRLGAREIPRNVYLDRLHKALKKDCLIDKI